MVLLLGILFVVVVVWHDLTQRKHAILRNFPIIGHFRYWLESVGPELRQYIVTDNNEERPFSRDQRRWVYASAKLENNYFGFGSDNELESSPNYPVMWTRTRRSARSRSSSVKARSRGSAACCPNGRSRRRSPRFAEWRTIATA